MEAGTRIQNAKTKTCGQQAVSSIYVISLHVYSMCILEQPVYCTLMLLIILLLWIRYQIMLKCWEEEPNDRPTFEHLTKTMKEMEKGHLVS